MKIKNILITGDDGYNAIGTRLLIHFLQDKYQLKIATTKEQQSGVGGKLNLGGDIKWGKASVDGVESVWVDGTPVDAVLFAFNYFKEKFDLIISGVNLGPNIGGGVMCSGTYAAAFSALNLRLGDKALAISWNCPPDSWLKDGKDSGSLETYLDYPGKMVNRIIDLALENELWGCGLLNINLPAKESRKVKFTKPTPDVSDFYDCRFNINQKEHYFNRPAFVADKKGDPRFDAGAVQRGYISITPCGVSVLKEDVYLKLKGKSIGL